MKISEMFPRKWMVGDDLQGKAWNVTIEIVQAEQMRVSATAAPETKYVMYLLGSRKGVILSPTLARQIAKILGEQDTKDWAGKKITIFPEPMKVGGQDRVAIRARAHVKPAADAVTPVGGAAEQAEAAELKDEEAEE